MIQRMFQSTTMISVPPSIEEGPSIWHGALLVPIRKGGLNEDECEIFKSHIYRLLLIYVRSSRRGWNGFRPLFRFLVPSLPDIG
jgi:hypothetical protein